MTTAHRHLLPGRQKAKNNQEQLAFLMTGFKKSKPTLFWRLESRKRSPGETLTLGCRTRKKGRVMNTSCKEGVDLVRSNIVLIKLLYFIFFQYLSKGPERHRDIFFLHRERCFALSAWLCEKPIKRQRWRKKKKQDIYIYIYMERFFFVIINCVN